MNLTYNGDCFQKHAYTQHMHCVLYGNNTAIHMTHS